jgi:PAS domain S-box-containing protein
MRGILDTGMFLQPAAGMEFVETVLEASTEYSIIGLRLDGSILLWNSGAKRLYGYEPGEVVGKAKVDLLHTPEDLAAGLPPAMRHAALADGKWEGIVAGVRRDGSHFSARVVLTPRRNREGEPIGFLLISRDISDDIRPIKELEATQAYARSLIESNIDALITTDQQGIITDVNQQTEALTGYRHVELVGSPFKQFFINSDTAEEGIRLAICDGRITNYELTTRGKAGRETVVSYNATVFHDREGRLQGVVAAARDITDRKRVDEALQEATLAAEQANQAKSEYLSRMSHELRTPLNAILGFAQVLEMDGLRDDQREGLGHIMVGGQHLLALINEVLDIAAIEAGRMPLSLEPVAVADVVAEAIALIRPLADKQGILLVDQPPTCDDHVLCDRQGILQILLNLLSNAVKYNREGGSVQLACDRVAGERMQIKVTDTGLGIPPESVERLFVPFDRLGSERTSIEGTGLGLSFSKRLAEAMAGTLELASTPGQGSTFWVELPLTETPVERLERAAPLPEDQPERERPALRVLCIEDNLSNLQLLAHILRRRPRVKLISSIQPQLGLYLEAEHQPDLILLDLGLPDMPGEEVLRRLRAGSKTADIPVVILSADARPDQITRVLGQGARSFLTKPLDVQELLALLDTIEAEHDQAGSSPSAPR